MQWIWVAFAQVGGGWGRQAVATQYHSNKARETTESAANAQYGLSPLPWHWLPVARRASLFERYWVSTGDLPRPQKTKPAPTPTPG